MNLNDQIDWNDTDRIVSNDTRYVSLSGDWWRESSTWQTRQNGSSALTRVGLTSTRLTGLANNGEAVLSCNGEANLTFRLGSYYFAIDLFDSTAAGGLANLETYATLNQTAANGDEADDLVSVETNQVYLAKSPETFAYDDDGNQTLITTKTGLWRVTYNGENRPILWVRDSDNMALTMSYDYMGRRREKNEHRFFYDGYFLVENNRDVGNLIYGAYFTWDPTETVAMRPLLREDATLQSVAASRRYYLHDGNKNISEDSARFSNQASKDWLLNNGYDYVRSDGAVDYYMKR